MRQDQFTQIPIGYCPVVTTAEFDRRLRNRQVSLEHGRFAPEVLYSKVAHGWPLNYRVNDVVWRILTILNKTVSRILRAMSLLARCERVLSSSSRINEFLAWLLEELRMQPVKSLYRNLSVLRFRSMTLLSLHCLMTCSPLSESGNPPP